MQLDSFMDSVICAVDDKKRLSLPTQHRHLFTEQKLPSGSTYLVVLVPWIGGSIAAFPVAEWKKRLAKIRLLDDMTSDYLAARRQLFPRIKFTHTDPEGRLTLAPEHLEWLRLPAKGKRKVMLTGADLFLEIWNADEWDEMQRTGQNPATRDAAHIQVP